MAFASTSIADACTAEADGPDMTGAAVVTGTPVDGGGAEDADCIDAKDMAELDAEDMAPGNPDTRLLESGLCPRK
jgi:hypothetical protein